MRKYRSHKIVEAAPVRQLDPSNMPPMWIDVGGGGGEVERIQVPLSFSARGVSMPGDYLVRYEDGYLSWSPKKAFEEGYDPI